MNTDLRAGLTWERMRDLGQLATLLFFYCVYFGVAFFPFPLLQENKSKSPRIMYVCKSLKRTNKKPTQLTVTLGSLFRASSSPKHPSQEKCRGRHPMISGGHYRQTYRDGEGTSHAIQLKAQWDGGITPELYGREGSTCPMHD